MDNKKGKKELLEWLKKLMEYARDNKLSMRITDSIEDCIKMAEKHNSDTGEIIAAVEELLESIGHKVAPPTEKNTGGERGISLEEIREQIAGMAQRCQSENAESLQNIQERKQAVIQKTYFDLQEITHCEAHLSELKNNDKYLEFYEKVRSSYENQALHVFKEFLNDLANNYQFMIDHMKSMFRSIGGENSGFGSRKFYEEHDIKRENISRELETMAQDADCGGKDIEELGNATKKKIRKTVKKSISRMRFFILLPVLVIFLLLGAGIVSKYVQLENVSDRVTQEQETKRLETKKQETKKQETEDSPEFVDEVKDIVENAAKKQIEKEVKKELEGKGIGEIIKGVFDDIIAPVIATVGAVMVFIVLLIIVIYAVYIMMLKKMRDRRICKKCNIYLQQEWSQFKQKDTLSQKMDNILNDLQEEYNRQYLDLLNQMFCKTDYDISDGNNKDQFEVLKEEWTAIKYG